MTNGDGNPTPQNDAQNAAAAQKETPKKRGCFTGCLCGLFKFSLRAILVVAVVWLCVYLIVDRKIKKLVVVDDVRQGVDWKNGEAVNYNALYNALQDKEMVDVESNGWRAILAALGPRALFREDLADTIPWEEFSTNEKTAKWFKTKWTPLCEAYKIDPNARPTMLDHMDLVPYLVKNGIKGDEEIVAEVDEENLSEYLRSPSDYEVGYYENFELKRGRVTRSEANDLYISFLNDPWTAETSPVAARWIQENDEFYQLIADAARSERFYVMKIVDDDPVKGSTLGAPFASSTTALRAFVRLFQIRFNYRIGTGDLDGAIDDFETIMLIGQKLVDSDASFLVEHLAGIGILSSGTALNFDARRDSRLSVEQRERIKKILDDAFPEGSIRRRCDRMRDVSAIEWLSISEHLLLFFRNANWEEFEKEGWDYFVDSIPDSLVRPLFLLSRAVPVNDPKTMNSFREMYFEAVDAEDYDAKLKELSDKRKLSHGKFCDRVFLSALQYASPGAALEAVCEAHSRSGCVGNLAVISQALQRYCDEKGTLPPAFTLDAEGRALQSWRVLILPYLGDEARALYEKIRLDEPWDSEYNRQFHSEIPSVYRCPSRPDAGEGETVYAAILTNDGFFDTSGVGVSLDERFAREDRETGNQIMVAEKNEPICWMRPDAELDATEFENEESDVALEEQTETATEDAPLEEQIEAASDDDAFDEKFDDLSWAWGSRGDGGRFFTAFSSDGKVREDGERYGHSGGFDAISASGGVRFVTSEMINEDAAKNVLWGVPIPERPKENDWWNDDYEFTPMMGEDVELDGGADVESGGEDALE